MKERIYRPVKPATRLLAVCAIALLAAAGVLALYAQSLLIRTLDGRVLRETQEHVTTFSLKEQMMQEQADSRVRGWMSMTGREEASITTARGTLHASLFEPVGSAAHAPWALVLHGGLGTDRNQVMDVACALSLEGYRVLTPDLYAHGESEGRVSSLGLADAQDVRAWCEWIVQQDAQASIVIYGQDEGGFAALMAAAQGLSDQVRAVAADSVYANAQKRMEALFCLDQGTCSDFESALLRAAYRMRHGVDVAGGDLTQLLKDCDLPLLIIHGTGDSDVPAWHSEDLAAAGKHAELLFAEGAAHGMARFFDPARVYGALFSFFEEALLPTDGRSDR